MSTAELRAFVGDEATQKHLLDGIWSRVGNGAPKDLVEDLVQQANLAMLSAKLGPHSAATAKGWASRVAVGTVIDYFRREEVQAKWVDREADVESLPPEPDDASGPFAPDWLVTTWLAPLVAGDLAASPVSLRPISLLGLPWASWSLRDAGRTKHYGRIASNDAFNQS